MSSTEDSIMQKLKISTAPMHEMLDRVPLLSKVMKDDLSDKTYACIIGKMHECFRLVESAILQSGTKDVFSQNFYESRIPDLKKDFEASGSKNLECENLSLISPPPLSASAAIGMLYVLHGSSMGGQFIARKLKSKIPANALNFYGQSEHFAPGLAKFKTKIDQSKTLNLDEATAGASWAFEVFYQIFKNDEI